VRTGDGYGSLSGRRLADMRPADDTETPASKRDPRDFALWKGAKPGEPFWETPWGPGRPGWHLECSAMSTHYLGPEFDIHGGGLDLLFPHHENERAQSNAAGDPFARYWMHNGLVGMSGEKMSKSVGNVLLVAELLTRVRPQELRYYLAQAHYRSAVEYSPEALEEAAAAYQRIERFVTRGTQALGGAEDSDGQLPVPFSDAMDDDLAVPAALAAVHATVRDGNYALTRADTKAVAGCLAQVRAMLSVLGLDPLAPAWQGGDLSDRLNRAVDGLVGLALRQREAARARGDYASADSIRDTLDNIGVVVEDTPEGPRWELKR
jgi:cysteinyl-tRNA synthetase